MSGNDIMVMNKRVITSPLTFYVGMNKFDGFKVKDIIDILGDT